MIYALESKKNNCKNCYKCIRGCPMKSISFMDNQASIIHDACILCGKCYLLCPQDAKEIRNDLASVIKMLSNHEKVIVSLAPSYSANWPNSSFNEIKKSLIKLGFYDVEETAIGATIVKSVYDQILSSGKKDILISSCCHSINLLIEKHYPELLPYLADVLSPMLAHGRDIKSRHKDAKVVFVGPCIAKKDEVDGSKDTNYVDTALTFIEIEELLKTNNVAVKEVEKDIPLEKSKARLFPLAGGIIKTMNCDAKDYQYLVIDGVENAISALNDIKNGHIHHCFIEMSACSGSCINGPAMNKDSRAIIKGYLAVSSRAGSKDFDTIGTYNDIKKVYNRSFVTSAIPAEEDIEKKMKEMGKTDKNKELNCGSCGYNTCREKAIAILQGKAVKEMCLPYLMERAQSFSNHIVYNTPNGLMVLDENLNIQLANKAMCEIVDVSSKEELIGSSITTILEPELFAKSLGGINTMRKKVYLSEYDKYVEETIIYDAKFHIIVAILKDITSEQKELLKKDEMIAKSVEITDKVIEKNMRVVQEIASLLGESAAETKVALNSLKDTLENDK